MDPKRRGHIVSWSIAGVREIFRPAGFNVVPLPGWDWAFLAEFGPPRTVPADDLMSWLWTPVPENLALPRDDEFGPSSLTFGLEAARCYLESAIAEARLGSARGLERQVRETARPVVRRVRWLQRVRAMLR